MSSTQMVSDTNTILGQKNSQAPADAKAQQALAALRVLGFKSILVVDDLFENTMAAMTALSTPAAQADMEFYACGGVEDALKTMNQIAPNGPCLVLTDLNMPNSDSDTFPSKKEGLRVVRECIERKDQLFFPAVVTYAGPSHHGKLVEVRYGNGRFSVEHPEAKSAQQTWGQIATELVSAFHDKNGAQRMLDVLRRGVEHMEGKRLTLDDNTLLCVYGYK